MSAETKTFEKRKQRLLKREKDHLVISHRKLQSYYRFQIEVNWSCHNHPVLHEDMPIQYQQNLIFINLFISQILSTTSFISESCYRFFDNSKRFKRLVSRCYSSTTDAKNSCTNLTAKVFTKSNKLPYLPETFPSIACHCHAKVLRKGCSGHFRENGYPIHGSQDTSKSNIDLFFQCALSLSSSMFVPT